MDLTGTYPGFRDGGGQEHKFFSPAAPIGVAGENFENLGSILKKFGQFFEEI